ncbi:hypothetical protein GO718_11425 [Eggerthella lenta]|uniref:hypothetical protein n=2 Tax=Eggerthellaceae TaxID=1643826 RepID=UPI0012EDA114|nr:hypothetical protein [Eggerthella lenta]MVM50279.1 hypothetical protein [Eggerthella lenta]MVN30998.1 hypothetical protein [Eggerthella lenta]MVN36799.1 hypothetical protein [Eggerthella lenta]
MFITYASDNDWSAMTRPERSAEMFRGVEKNYWEYYRELEDDFLATRKYVSFHEANASTFSLEYLKLFQAVCSEIDVVGKAMAAACNQEFEPESSANNIYKWWYEIQEMYRCYEDAKSAVTGRGGVCLADCARTLLNGVSMEPWKGFETEWRIVKNGSRRCFAKGNSTPGWWTSYNKVKHSRIVDALQDEGIANYARANLGNLMHAFAGLHILETAFMEAVGTLNDLERFANQSRLFDKVEFAATEDIDGMF